MDGSLQDLDSSAIHQREIQFWIKVQMRLNHVLKNDSPALESISEYERTKLMDELEYNEFQSMKQAKFCLGLPVGEGLPQVENLKVSEPE